MPEGPEIKRAADRISKALAGQEVEKISFLYPSISKHQKLISGAKVTSVNSHAKAMLINFDNGFTLYSHNQLYGKWTINMRTTVNRSRRSLRVEFLTSKKAIRLWSATDIELIPTDKVKSHPFIKNLGPDVLCDFVDYSVLSDRLQSKDCRNRMAAHLMLDQKSFAGLGNYLRSEILFFANINPYLKPRELDSNSLLKWAVSIKDISMRAYLNNGITVSKDIEEQGKLNGEARRYWRHYVFTRNDRPCRICSSKIVRLRFGGRRLDYCPTCQD